MEKDGSTDGLLQISLAAAVPLWVARLKSRPWPELQARAQECSQMIAEHGDVILYKGKKKGETAKAFNMLAEAIAILSFMPGGITTFGQHWESHFDPP